jgi:hypothetical protein
VANSSPTVASADAKNGGPILFGTLLILDLVSWLTEPVKYTMVWKESPAERLDAFEEGMQLQKQALHVSVRGLVAGEIESIGSSMKTHTPLSRR